MKKSKVLASFLALALVTQGIPVNVLAAEVARDVEKISVTNQDGMIRRSNDSLIKDPKLEEGIRAQLKLNPGQELTKSMLEGISELTLTNKGIESLDGLENCKGLRKLNLNGNKISNVMPIKILSEKQGMFSGMTNLDLRGNRIQDISPLKDMARYLDSFYLEDQKIETTEYVNKPDMNGSYTTSCFINDINGAPMIPIAIKANGSRNGSYSPGQVKWTNLNEDKNVLEYEFSSTGIEFGFGGKASFTGKVVINLNVNKGEAPVIKADPVTVKQGSEFDVMSGVTATDKEGRVDKTGKLINSNEEAKDITSSVKCTNKEELKLDTPGNYTLKYEVTDSWGNKATAERTLVVEKVAEPDPDEGTSPNPNPSVPSVPSDKDVVTEEIVGSNRFETALKISDKWTNADNIVITNSDSTVDAMTAAPFAYAKDAPVLLSKADTLSKVTKDRVKELKAKTVYLIGGEAVLSSSIEKELKDMGIKVIRISGSNRFETSLNIAKEIDRIKDVSKIAVVNGQSGLADSVSISAPAAMNNMPIILSDNKGNIPAGRDFISAEDISMSYIAGGNAVVPTSVENELKGMTKATVSRLAGKNRLETNANVINEFYKNSVLSNVFVVKDGSKSSADLVDALAISPYAARINAPVMLVGKDLDQSQEKLIEGKKVEKVTRVGGNGNENAFEEILDIVK